MCIRDRCGFDLLLQRFGRWHLPGARDGAERVTEAARRLAIIAGIRTHAARGVAEAARRLAVVARGCSEAACGLAVAAGSLLVIARGGGDLVVGVSALRAGRGGSRAADGGAAGRDAIVARAGADIACGLAEAAGGLLLEGRRWLCGDGDGFARRGLDYPYDQPAVAQGRDVASLLRQRGAGDCLLYTSRCV